MKRTIVVVGLIVVIAVGWRYLQSALNASNQ